MKKLILLFILSLSVIFVNAQGYDLIKKGIRVGSGGTKTVIDTTELKSLNGVTTPIPSLLGGKLDTSAVVDYFEYMYSQSETDSLVGLNTFSTTEFLKKYGSAVKTTTVIANLFTTNSTTLTDNTLMLYALEKQNRPVVCTEARYFQWTAGDYTADNENRIGLYKLVGTTYTLVASIPDDGNLWKTASNTVVTKTFTTPYTALANEQLYLGFLYNNSAQTTAPLLQGVNSGNTQWFHTSFTGTTTYLVGQKGTTNTLPTTFETSATSRANTIPLVLIF